MSDQQACPERIRLLQTVTAALSAHAKAAQELGAAADIETDEEAFKGGRATHTLRLSRGGESQRALQAAHQSTPLERTSAVALREPGERTDVVLCQNRVLPSDNSGSVLSSR